LLQYLPLLVQVLLLQERPTDVAGPGPYCCCVHGNTSMLTTCYQPLIHG
jgi:hypothetical protein